MVGGDMDIIEQEEHAFHKVDDVDLKDVWEETAPSPGPIQVIPQEDLTYGREPGGTWGYQWIRRVEGRRTNEFLCTGRLEIVALDEGQDHSGKIGGQGIGLKTDVEAWEHVRTETSLDVWESESTDYS